MWYCGWVLPKWMWWGVGRESGPEGVLVLKVSDYVSGSPCSACDYITCGLLLKTLERSGW
jgi:hypothetical protein